MSVEGLPVYIKTGLISRRTFIAFLCLAISACAGPTLSGLDTSRTPPRHLIEGVPFFKQAAHQCGPAAMASVLNYRGIKVSPEEIIGAIYSRGAAGTLDFDMVLYAGKQGRKVEKYQGALENLRKNVDSNNPLIVLVDYGFLSYRRNHFMVVLGYDESHIYVNSGLEPIAAISNDEFIRTWKKTNFWTLLID
jgi:ABC-type bacteriocin/lantibiotic exporter with double-glycine peptidase domain